eukprot:8837402-Ditylum_brightwellii.AAC.1
MWNYYWRRNYFASLMINYGWLHLPCGTYGETKTNSERDGIACWNWGTQDLNKKQQSTINWCGRDPTTSLGQVSGTKAFRMLSGAKPAQTKVWHYSIGLG